MNQRVTLKENTQKEKGIENHAQIEIKNFQEVDPLPLLGCLDLLLGDVALAQERFNRSPDQGLRDWLANYPGDQLAGLCEYCRDWLHRDVLPGYRDVDAGLVDLEAWFADRDVQAYVESLENKGALGIAKSSFSFLSSLSSLSVTLEISFSFSSLSLLVFLPASLQVFQWTCFSHPHSLTVILKAFHPILFQYLLKYFLLFFLLPD